jgi:WD40 repeat protein
LQLTGVDGGCGSMQVRFSWLSDSQTTSHGSPSAQFSDDDRFLAATGGGEVVCVWDMQTGLLATAFKCDKPCSVLLWGSRTLPSV